MENDKQKEKSVMVDDDKQYLNSLPPGYRFRPTDKELLSYYLKRKLLNKRLPPNNIKEGNIYNSTPYHLADMYDEQREGIMYFFTPRERKYPNGSRPSRAAGNGYWKASGKAEIIKDDDGITPIGYKRSLVYFQGDPKGATKTDWLMNEFTLKNKGTSTIIRDGPNDMQLDRWVLCKIYKKQMKKDQGGNREVAASNSVGVPGISELPTMLAELPTTHAMGNTSGSQMPGGHSHAMGNTSGSQMPGGHSHAMGNTSGSQMPGGHSHATCSASRYQMPVYSSGYSRSQMPVYNNGHYHATSSSSQMFINNGHSHTTSNPRIPQMVIYSNGQNRGQSEIGFPMQQEHLVPHSSQVDIYNNGQSEIGFPMQQEHLVPHSSQVGIYNNGQSEIGFPMQQEHLVPHSSQVDIYNNGQSEIGFPMQQEHLVSPLIHNHNSHIQPNQGFVDPQLSLLEGNNTMNESQGTNMSDNLWDDILSDLSFPEDFNSSLPDDSSLCLPEGFGSSDNNKKID